MVVVSIFIMVVVSVNKNKNIRIVLNQGILIVSRMAIVITNISRHFVFIMAKLLG